MKLLSSILTVGILASGSVQAATLDISFNPSISNTTTTGPSVSLDLIGTALDMDSLDTVNVLITFDPSLVSADSVEVYGPFSSVSGPWTGAPAIDNTAGTVGLNLSESCFLLGCSYPSTGDVSFANLVFSPVGSSGNTLLILSIWNDDNVAIVGGTPTVVTPSFTDGAINVVPIPPAGWLMLSATALFGLIGRRRTKVGTIHSEA